eukprot:TRINITY_DN12715_c0_g1_i1.p1 TRINITY_DN12715_c0_g1~~TRINITY_DN12715_c0_g1_i1.p1  ORF type:complete len:324 (-),score=63.96 TRINITY_DN12715_c0_g1_i1:226-1197(-)
MPMQLGGFLETADDDVLLMLCVYSGTPATVGLASTSMSVLNRVDDSPSGPHSRPSVLVRVAANQLASSAGAARAAATSASSSCREATSSTLVLLQVLAAAARAESGYEVLGLALALSGNPEQNDCDADNIFMDALFRWEVQRRRDASKGSHRSLAAADAVLTALFALDMCAGKRLLEVASRAIAAAEDELDTLVETQAEALLSYSGSGYEAIARKRSAAEFMKRRILSTTCDIGFRNQDDAVRMALQSLERSTVSLDETIAGYDKEGYTLVCPQLVGNRCMQRLPIPYDHWWVRLDGPSMEPVYVPLAFPHSQRMAEVLQVCS